ncbi:hypothetical protein [Stenotrophomonas sp. PS02300]|uniref:hypothetical protein n=1 Tax=Stenotrophomonas sp. PS02300 TaxID=2991426 RepID=UPI00249A40C1|nr:hypothetical protein [Stenotrophomonas sp. PS02300]
MRKLLIAALSLIAAAILKKIVDETYPTVTPLVVHYAIWPVPAWTLLVSLTAAAYLGYLLWQRVSPDRIRKRVLKAMTQPKSFSATEQIVLEIIARNGGECGKRELRASLPTAASQCDWTKLELEHALESLLGGEYVEDMWTPHGGDLRLSPIAATFSRSKGWLKKQ